MAPAMNAVHATAVITSNGMHGRPTADLVSLARQFEADVKIRPKGSSYRDAKRIFRLGQGVSGTCRGSELELLAVGADAEEAVAALKRYLEAGLHPREAQPLRLESKRLEALLGLIRSVVDAGEIEDGDREELRRRMVATSESLRHTANLLERSKVEALPRYVERGG